MPDAPVHREPLFERLFLRYGAGSAFLLRVSRTRFWPIASWVLIGLGILVWGVVFWMLRE